MGGDGSSCGSTGSPSSGPGGGLSGKGIRGVITVVARVGNRSDTGSLPSNETPGGNIDTTYVCGSDATALPTELVTEEPRHEFSAELEMTAVYVLVAKAAPLPATARNPDGCLRRKWRDTQRRDQL